MFERYTEKARRAIFYSRYEASQFGSPYIETEHLLLGLLREDHALGHQFFGTAAPLDEFYAKVRARTPMREKTLTSTDLPLSNECKRVLAYAAEEADQLSHRHIGTEHLFLGLLREEKSFAALLLFERGVRLEEARKVLTKGMDVSVVAPPFPGGLGSGRAGAHYRVTPPEVEFVCGDATVGRVFSVGPFQRVPRIDEEVVLGGKSYRVEDISSTFETPPQAPHDSFLQKITIKLKES